MLMKKMLAIILVSLVLSGCEKNGSQNDLIINNTEEENVVMDENDGFALIRRLRRHLPPRRGRLPIVLLISKRVLQAFGTSDICI